MEERIGLRLDLIETGERRAKKLRNGRDPGRRGCNLAGFQPAGGDQGVEALDVARDLQSRRYIGKAVLHLT